MPNWNYELNGCKLQLEDNPVATYEGEVPDIDYLSAEIDAEVHRLTSLIQTAETEIYKLRKFQRVLKKQ